jgi:hypothetical protein
MLTYWSLCLFQKIENNGKGFALIFKGIWQKSFSGDFSSLCVSDISEFRFSGFSKR